MNKINPVKALYVKLGEGGKYEKECLTSPGMIHVGWKKIDHELCISGKWEKVRKQCLEIYQSSQQAATSRMNQLRHFYESNEDVIWVTFHQEILYWCFVKNEFYLEKDYSKTRPTLIGWNNCDIRGNLLNANNLSGSLLAMQGFRGVICNVNEYAYLIRKINGESSPTEKRAIEARESLMLSLVEIIQNLNWKEFELLIDLIFRQAGWQRLGPVGKTTKGIDLDLISPIDQERYKVQVKSKAGNEEFQTFLTLASDMDFARYYLVVHKPDENLLNEVGNPYVRLWLPENIARLVVNYGLADWIIAKAK